MNAAPYRLSPAEATFLAGLVATPAAEREALAGRMLASIPPAELVRLFLAVIGMAERTIENGQEMSAECLYIAGVAHPDRPQSLPNWPTLLGACLGVALAADVDPDKVCDGCAFRLGSCANMSSTTVADASHCLGGSGYPFMCHEDLDAAGEPLHLCRGFAIALKAAGAAADA